LPLDSALRKIHHPLNNAITDEAQLPFSTSVLPSIVGIMNWKDFLEQLTQRPDFGARHFR
jgi:hypothetical protein